MWLLDWFRRARTRAKSPKPQPTPDDLDFIGSPEHFYLMEAASQMAQRIRADRQQAADADKGPAR